MDAGSVTKPVFVQVTSTEPRPGTTTSVNQTALPADKAVLPAREADRARLDRDNRSPSEEASGEIITQLSAVERRVTIDDESGRVLLQAVHSGSGDIVWQLPAETILRISSYGRELDAQPKASDPGQDQVSTQGLTRDA
ncbi:MAG: hypothetical protein AAFX39_14440 [Pseudomonadota bacterium]